MKISFFIMLMIICQIGITSEKCDSPSSQSDMNLCAGIKLKNIESKLKEKLTTLKNTLIDKENVKLLRNSNLAWEKYRNLHCESTSKIYESGSIHSFIEAECKSEVTKRRINDIELDYKNTVNIIFNGNP